MDPDMIMQGQQLLYSNQFDQLTYNADNIITLTSELDQCLKKFSYSFSSKDSALIINKNLTPFVYWLVIDALYFVQNTSYQSDRINYLRKKKNPNRSSSILHGEEFDDQKFVIKMRYLAYKNKPLPDIQQVKQDTTIDELIELFEKQHENISKKNDQIVTELTSKATESKELFQTKFKQLSIEYVPASRLLAYYKFSKQMIREWMDQIENKKSKSKCKICQRSSDRLLKCQKCDLKVHPICYPKLGKNYFQNSFVCQNCEKGLDENTSCIYCPIKGGHFLQVQTLSQARSQYSKKFLNQLGITKQEGLKLKFHKKIVPQQKSYIHLACALWHPELEYNKKNGQIQYIHRVDRRKTQNWCYQCGTNAGVTIPCANQNCRRFYHPQCALRIELSTCIINAQNKMLLELYCDRHKRPYIYETLKDNILTDLKEIKKFFQGVDHQIKRMNSTNYTSDRKIFISSKSDEPERKQNCMYCQNENSNFNEKIVNCSKCYNWYHKLCANRCLYCQPIYTDPIKKLH